MSRSGWVSIPSRGFWFFEGQHIACAAPACGIGFQSPRGDFGFLKSRTRITLLWLDDLFQSPRGDFGFLKVVLSLLSTVACVIRFQSPRGDFGFLKLVSSVVLSLLSTVASFNPLAGILVF